MYKKCPSIIFQLKSILVTLLLIFPLTNFVGIAVEIHMDDFPQPEQRYAGCWYW